MRTFGEYNPDEDSSEPLCVRDSGDNTRGVGGAMEEIRLPFLKGARSSVKGGSFLCVVLRGVVSVLVLACENGRGGNSFGLLGISGFNAFICWICVSVDECDDSEAAARKSLPIMELDDVSFRECPFLRSPLSLEMSPILVSFSAVKCRCETPRKL